MTLAVSWQHLEYVLELVAKICVFKGSRSDLLDRLHGTQPGAMS